MPNLYIIAGPNGAGKTTFAREFLLPFVDCYEFVNADMIAAGLSPFAPETVALQAGRLMLERIQKLSEQRVDFAFETTLSGKTYVRFIREVKDRGYEVHLVFLWLSDVEFSARRVAHRVKQGGHNIPDEVIRRRFGLGIRNLFQIYRPLLDSWKLYDNTKRNPQLIAEEIYGTLQVADPDLYQKLSVS